CHAMIDPAGFALDNFDPVGSYRVVDRDTFASIDASGVLPDGTPFDGLAAFKAKLIREPERFATTVVQKLLTYALGRGLEDYDMPAVGKIPRDSANRRYRFPPLVLGIGQGAPSQLRPVTTTAASKAATLESGR